jgi:hypothetical protein
MNLIGGRRPKGTSIGVGLWVNMISEIAKKDMLEVFEQEDTQWETGVLFVIRNGEFYCETRRFFINMTSTSLYFKCDTLDEVKLISTLDSDQFDDAIIVNNRKYKLELL